MSGRFEDRLKDLKGLPELDPPAAIGTAALRAMEAAAKSRPRRHLPRAAAWIAVPVAGALLAAWALTYEPPTESPQTTAPADEEIFDLVEQSMRLEEILALLPEPRRVMRTDTASTIVGLEDQIALIDTALYHGETAAAPPEYRKALLRDRVEVMNALINVRYAQSRAFLY